MDTPRLLVLDDHANTRLLIAYSCPATWELTQCTHCAEARSALTSWQFDLLVLDIKLPDGSGRDVLHFARTHPTSQNPATPAIAVTATVSTSPEQAAAQYDQVFDAHMLKPFRPAALLKLFHTHLNDT